MDLASLRSEYESRGIDIADLDPDPVRDAVVRVAVVVVGGRWISACKWIDPAARPNPVLPTI